MPLSSYDVIVVGAGLGGLSAAARLVKAGLRVLVLDRSPHVAGTAYTYQRAGFHFPMGPLGFSSPAVIRKILADLGDEGPLKLKRVDYRLRAFGLDLPLSRPRVELEETLVQLFPEEAPGLNRFFNRMEDLARLFRNPPSESRRSTLETAAAIPAREFLEPNIQDQRLKRILGSQGTSEPYTALPLLAAMWNLMLHEGIWYPEDGLRTIGDRLRRRVTDPGGKGEIRLGTEVVRISLRGGKVGGVELTSGERWAAPKVISNADFKNTFLRLLERRALPGELYREVQEARQTESNLQVSLGLKKDRVDLTAFARAGRLIYRRPEEEPPPDWDQPEIRPENLAAGELELSLWTRDDPSLAPEGGAVLIIRTAADYGHFARHRPGWKQRSPTYAGYKMRLGQALVREAETILPGLTDAVQWMDVATPLTFEERGGRSGGAVAGWSWNFEETRDPMPRELVRTPLSGLFMAGYQAFSSLFTGGVPSALESGRRAADYILRGEGPVGDLRLPGQQKGKDL